MTAYDLDPVNPLSSTATLTITIIDINDNNPIFDDPVYYNNDVVENTRTIVISTSASDSDIGTNSDLTYVISGGNEDSTFVIGEYSYAHSTNWKIFIM